MNMVKFVVWLKCDYKISRLLTQTTSYRYVIINLQFMQKIEEDQINQSFVF